MIIAESTYFYTYLVAEGVRHPTHVLLLGLTRKKSVNTKWQYSTQQCKYSFYHNVLCTTCDAINMQIYQPAYSLPIQLCGDR